MASAEYHRQWREARREKHRAYLRVWYAANKERVVEQARVAHLRRKYGLSDEEFEGLALAQNNRCAICSRMLLRGSFTHIDHEHKTGQIRGLLCVNCNNGLGQFFDRPEVLRAAAHYLEKFNG